jgi:hypothetical protein
MPFDPARVLRASKLRFGGFRATGLPAILLGVSAVVLAGGVARSLSAFVPMLPETLRETKNVIETAKRDGRLLTP